MKRQRHLAVMIGVILLSAGLMLMSVNRGAQAAPPASNPGNPFQEILNAINALQPPPPTDLSGVTQNWDKKLTTGRFTVLSAFGWAAVRDNETGLVWETAPTGGGDWNTARSTGCVFKSTGGRFGWRLPAISELTSLIEPTVGLPEGHPFTGNFTNRYWSATTLADVPASAWSVLFSNGSVGGNGKTIGAAIWCVRGGMIADAD